MKQVHVQEARKPFLGFLGHFCLFVYPGTYRISHSGYNERVGYFASFISIIFSVHISIILYIIYIIFSIFRISYLLYSTRIQLILDSSSGSTSTCCLH